MKHKESGKEVDFLELCLRYRSEMSPLFRVVDDAESGSAANNGELAAFAAYAMAFPNGFLALVDTYDTLR